MNAHQPIKTLNGLMRAARMHRSVRVWTNRRSYAVYPAAFVIGWPARTVWWAIHIKGMTINPKRKSG